MQREMGYEGIFLLFLSTHLHDSMLSKDLPSSVNGLLGFYTLCSDILVSFPRTAQNDIKICLNVSLISSLLIDRIFTMHETQSTAAIMSAWANVQTSGLGPGKESRQRMKRLSPIQGLNLHCCYSRYIHRKCWPSTCLSLVL